MPLPPTTPTPEAAPMPALVERLRRLPSCWTCIAAGATTAWEEWEEAMKLRFQMALERATPIAPPSERP